MANSDTPVDSHVQTGALSVARRAGTDQHGLFETFIRINADGAVTAYNGHVDLGTGIRTALGQIVAEELDVAFARVVVVLGDTSLVPNQGATIASETIQITAVPLRQAAAQARQFLLARAAERLELAITDLAIEDGLIRGSNNRSVSYGELIGAEIIRLELADDTPVKAVSAYGIVGQSVPRVDLPAKATGELVYVHDVRIPGMLHGRVVRPPYAGVDAGAFVGTSLIAVDESSVRDIAGVVAVVRIGDFVGVVAEREENAIKAASQLKVSWKPVPALPDLKDIETALRANPSQPRTLLDKGDVDGAIAGAAKPMPRTYLWPYQMHASIGPSCAVADYQDDAHQGLVGHPEPAPPAHRSCPAAGAAGKPDRGDPAGSGRLLWPQLRRRCHRRCVAVVTRGRPPGPGAADTGAGTRLGAEGHRATDVGQWRCERRRQRRRLMISPRAIPRTPRRHWHCC